MFGNDKDAKSILKAAWQRHYSGRSMPVAALGGLDTIAVALLWMKWRVNPLSLDARQYRSPDQSFLPVSDRHAGSCVLESSLLSGLPSRDMTLVTDRSWIV
jgi:hypothetical protein